MIEITPDEKLLEKIQNYARQTGLSSSEVVLEILQAYFTNTESVASTAYGKIVSLRDLIDARWKDSPEYMMGYHTGHSIGQYEAILSVMDIITAENVQKYFQAKENK